MTAQEILDALPRLDSLEELALGGRGSADLEDLQKFPNLRVLRIAVTSGLALTGIERSKVRELRIDKGSIASWAPLARKRVPVTRLILGDVDGGCCDRKRNPLTMADCCTLVSGFESLPGLREVALVRAVVEDDALASLLRRRDLRYLKFDLPADVLRAGEVLEALRRPEHPCVVDVSVWDGRAEDYFSYLCERPRPESWLCPGGERYEGDEGCRVKRTVRELAWHFKRHCPARCDGGCLVIHGCPNWGDEWPEQ